jgi:acetolactate synthase-1/2/3 large subunit
VGRTVLPLHTATAIYYVWWSGTRAGFPAAIGAQLAFPNAVVIDIAGDGSFQMNVQELATVVQYNLPVIVAILNNHSLGMVRQWQQFL